MDVDLQKQLDHILQLSTIHQDSDGDKGSKIDPIFTKKALTIVIDEVSHQPTPQDIGQIIFYLLSFKQQGIEISNQLRQCFDMLVKLRKQGRIEKDIFDKYSLKLKAIGSL